MAKSTTPESLYGNSRDILREAERENEILADIAGETYESPGNIPNGKYVIEKRLLDAAQKKNELLESIAEGGGGGGGGGGAAKAIGIDYATDVIFLKNKDGETIADSGATLPAYGVSFDPTTGGLTLTKNGTAVQGQTVTIPNYGSPVGVTDSADMVDEGTIYLYEGETGGGFTNGHFYYYDGSAWADGGEYAAATVQTDKTLLVEDRAADAKATGEAVGELKTHLDEITIKIYTYTPFSNYTVTDGYYIGTSGNPVSADTFEYITFSVNPGDVFRVSAWAGQSARLWLIKDSNGNVLSYHSYSGSQSQQIDTVVVPSNGATFIVNNNNTHDFQIESASFELFVDGEKVTIDNDTLDNIISDIYNRIELKVDESEVTPIFNSTTTSEATADAQASDITETDDYYMFTSGATSDSNLWRYFTYIIPETAKKLIVSAYAGQSARLWILKDGNGNIIGYSDDSSTASAKTETINLSLYAGARTLIVNDRKSDNFSIKYTYDTTVIDSYKIAYNNNNVGNALDTISAETEDINNSNVLYGKILCCCGDSITYGADMDAEGITDESNIPVYQSNAAGEFTQTQAGFRKTWNWQIASKNKMTLYNAGVSGSTMQGEGGVNGFSLANGRYTKLPDNIDYLLIWFGWNDNAYGTLGTIDDVTNASYYGGYNVVLPYLLNKYPYAKIGLIVPFGSSAGHREAIRQLGDKWGIAVWDNYYGGTPLYYGKEDSVGVEASVVTANRAKFQANGAHPNFKGHRELGDMIGEWMRTL